MAQKRRALPLGELQRNMEQLVELQTDLEERLLPALERLLPALEGRDQAMARQLQRHLLSLSFNNRRDILLKRFLLMRQDSDGAGS